MNALELIGQIDEQHHLRVSLPEDALPGQVRVIVVWPDIEDTKSEATLTRDWLAASTPSLQQVWDNEEDAVYDHL